MTYWHYTYLRHDNSLVNFGYGIQVSRSDEFDFADYYRKYPCAFLMSVNEISAEQYEALDEHIDRMRRDGIHE